MTWLRYSRCNYCSAYCLRGTPSPRVAVIHLAMLGEMPVAHRDDGCAASHSGFSCLEGGAAVRAIAVLAG